MPRTARPTSTSVEPGRPRAAAAQAARPGGLPARLPFSYGWVCLAVAALAMVGTLPGRTHGLGLVTEPLLRDIPVSRELFGAINLWATFLGAAFCLPAGPLLDRFGTRPILGAVALALGVTVLAMSRVGTAPALFVTITLTRGFGQAALSVVSLAVVGKWFGRRLGPAMGVYSVLVGLGFMAAFAVVGPAAAADWRAAWAAVGWALALGLAPLAWLLLRNTPEACGLAFEGPAPAPGQGGADGPAFTLGQALRAPAFWAFALASSVFLLVSSSTSLFGQSILERLGFDRPLFIRASVLTTFVALGVNFLAGWLAGRWPLGRLLGVAMAVLTAAVGGLPLLRTRAEVYLYAGAMGVAGGVVTVVFFAVWGRVFGRAHLGKIAGAAQLLTVVASGLGQWLPPLCLARYGSYAPLFFSVAPVTALLGLWAWCVRLPADNRGDRQAPSPLTFPEGEPQHAGNA